MLDEKRDFDQSLIDLADVAKALSHPGRLRILQILAKERSCICGDIVQQLPFSQSTVSQHLKELKRVGLIAGEISGPRTCYCLDTGAILKAGDGFSQLFQVIGCCRPNNAEGETHEL